MHMHSEHLWESIVTFYVNKYMYFKSDGVTAHDQYICMHLVWVAICVILAWRNMHTGTSNH